VKPLLSWQRPRLPISGGDLIAMGLSAGPQVARTLQAVEREWAGSGFTTDREQVRALARQLVDQTLRESQ
jgi:poly(A) polymerase